MTLNELVEGTKGEILSQHETVFTGIGTDTRQNLDGQIFIALKGEQFDAHQFLDKAQGAGALLVHEVPPEALLKKITVVKVPDTLIAMQNLANYWRRKMPAKIVGITGTNGKTTSKEFTAAVLKQGFKVHYSKGSLNNHWGVPMSLLALTPEHEVAVIEMGMNHAGELKRLAEIAEPDICVVTMVGRGHLEGLGSIEGVAEAKSEIYRYSPKSCLKIFNLDNPQTKKMFTQFKQSNSITFSSSQQSSVALQVTASDASGLEIKGEIQGVAGSARVEVFGAHNITNLMVAASIGLACKMSPEKVWEALTHCRNTWGRNQWVTLESGTKVLFDGYNANPESMQAALMNFSQLKTPGRKFAILGEMRELGSNAASLHREVGELAGRCDFDGLFFVGPSASDFAAGAKHSGFQKNLFVTTTYEISLASTTLPVLDHDDVVLIKGSRGMQLEDVLLELKPVDFKKK